MAIATIPAILMVISSIGLDLAEHHDLDAVAYWRIFSLFGIGLLIGLTSLILLEYLIQLIDHRRRYIPIDRIGLLFSYLGFVSLMWAEIYIKFRGKDPVSYRVILSSLFMTIGVVSLARKLYRVHHLTDEDKRIEDHQPI